MLIKQNDHKFPDFLNILEQKKQAFLSGFCIKNDLLNERKDI